MRKDFPLPAAPAIKVLWWAKNDIQHFLLTVSQTARANGNNIFKLIWIAGPNRQLTKTSPPQIITLQLIDTDKIFFYNYHLPHVVRRKKIINITVVKFLYSFKLKVYELFSPLWCHESDLALTVALALALELWQHSISGIQSSHFRYWNWPIRTNDTITSVSNLSINL